MNHWYKTTLPYPVVRRERVISVTNGIRTGGEGFIAAPTLQPAWIGVDCRRIPQGKGSPALRSATLLQETAPS